MPAILNPINGKGEKISLLRQICQKYISGYVPYMIRPRRGEHSSLIIRLHDLGDP